MKLTRHAKNRLRWIARSHPGVTESGLLDALATADALTEDDPGNRRIEVHLREVRLMAVVDEGADMVITVWVD